MQNLSARTCLRNATLAKKNAGGAIWLGALFDFLCEILRGSIGRLEHGATMPNPSDWSVERLT